MQEDFIYKVRHGAHVYTPVTHKSGAEGWLQIWGQPGLHSDFNISGGHTVKTYLQQTLQTVRSFSTSQSPSTLTLFPLLVAGIMLLEKNWEVTPTSTAFGALPQGSPTLFLHGGH